MPYFETSSKLNEGIDTMFTEITKELCKQHKSKTQKPAK